MAFAHQQHQQQQQQQQQQMQEEKVSTDTANCITLKGSIDIVVEFFQYSINSILYQRGIYPPKMFTPCKHYNLQMMVTTDEELQRYLNRVLSQLHDWLMKGNVSRLVLVIASQNDPNNILERWQFNIITEKVEWQNNSNSNENNNNNNNNQNNENNSFFGNNNNSNNNNNFNKNNINYNTNPNGKNKKLKNVKNGKSIKEIQREIQAIMRQITSSVTFLPLLEGPCSFDLLIYTNKDCNVPQQWELSDPKFINNSENVKLRSFTTKIHKVDSVVSYKVSNDDDDDDDDDGDLEL